MDELGGRSAFRADDGDVVAEIAASIIPDFRRNEGSVEKTQPSIHHLPGTATVIAALGGKRSREVGVRSLGGVS